MRSVSALLVALACLWAWPRDASACAGDVPTVENLTTFDGLVLDDARLHAFLFDVSRPAFDEACTDCADREMREDWAGFFGPTINADEWMSVLLKAPLPAIDQLIFFLQGKQKAPPSSLKVASLAASQGPLREKVISALFFVGFARRVEPFSTLNASRNSWEPPPAPGPDATPQVNEKLRTSGMKALERAKDPFLRQRYAFQVLRLWFYSGIWDNVTGFFLEQRDALAGPSASLRWRANSYWAGAALVSGPKGRALVELARVHANFPPLAGPSANAFTIKDDAEWRDALEGYATEKADKVALWRLVGMRYDAVLAMKELAKLDPSSTAIGLLAVRELNRIEAHEGDGAAKSPRLRDLETTSLALSGTPGLAQSWLLSMVSAHASALRGDLAATRTRLAAARKNMPSNRLAEAQSKATLAMALASDAPTSPKLGDELAGLISGLGDYSRSPLVTQRVRALLLAKTKDPGQRLLLDPSRDLRSTKALREAIARVDAVKSPYERFLLTGSGLEGTELPRRLALALIVERKYPDALEAVEKLPPEIALQKLGTDPFVLHVRDCHDCDHEKYAKAPWTLRSLVSRLVELERTSQGTGEPAAKALFDLGAAHYNLTWYGNARAVLDGEMDTRPAMELFGRVVGLSKDRELQARAAYMAAKCEQAAHLTAARGNVDELPFSEKWFPVLATYADTRYHREVLAECGHYRAWKQRRR